MLSSDDITKFDESRVHILKKLLPPSGVSAVFDNSDYKVGRIKKSDGEIICIFNYSDTQETAEFNIDGHSEIIDYITNEQIKISKEDVNFKITLNAHSAKALQLITNSGSHL